MTPAWKRLQEAIGWCAIVALVVVCLPLVALATILLRTLLLPVAFLAIVATVAAVCSRERCRTWFDSHFGVTRP